MFLALLGTFIQTPATLMCANRRTRNSWMTVESVTCHCVRAHPKANQLEQLSKTSIVCSESVSSLNYSFFPGNHSRQKGSEKLIFTWWNQRAHYLLVR